AGQRHRRTIGRSGEGQRHGAGGSGGPANDARRGQAQRGEGRGRVVDQDREGVRERARRGNIQHRQTRLPGAVRSSSDPRPRRLPAPSKSPTATEPGAVPAAKVSGAEKVPSPLPSSTETVLESELATTRSGLPSSLKSPTATERGAVPAAKVSGAEKVPSPLP